MLNITNHQGNTDQNYNEIHTHTCQDGPPTLLVGMYLSTSSRENSMEGSQKLNIELPYDSAIPLLGTSKKTQNTNSKRYMNPSVHSSITYNCREMEAT